MLHFLFLRSWALYGFVGIFLLFCFLLFSGFKSYVTDKITTDTFNEKQAQADALYRQQLQLNQLHRQAVADRDGYKNQLEAERQKTTALVNEKAALSSKLYGAWDVAQNAQETMASQSVPKISIKPFVSVRAWRKKSRH